MFEKALKTVEVKLEEKLVWESERDFLEQLWIEIRNELGDVQWTREKFLDRVNQEVESRKIDLRKFRNEKNEPITNMFKKLIREIAKENNIQLSNDSLSKLINYIRNQYSSEGILSAGMYPAEAFFKRSKYGIPEDLGDDDSCFRPGCCNEGNALWLITEDEKFNRAKLIVFHYKSGNKEGVGRCWVYKVSDWAIFATNFYSSGFDIKAQWLKYPVVRVLRLLFDMSENVRFAYKNICLPIYLNGNGLIIYEKDQYSSSEEVFELSRKIVSECMYCGKEFTVRELGKYDERVYYSPVGAGVKGIIVCEECRDELDGVAECAWCGERFDRDKMYYHDDRWWCEDCFNERFVPCEYCGEYFCLEDIIVDRYENCLCQNCAAELRRQCVVCGKYDYPEEVHKYKVLTYGYIEEVYVCTECQKDFIKMKCEKCGYEFFYRESDYREDDKIREIVRAGLCPECYRNRLLESYVPQICNTDFSNA